ncbi:DUF5988 family protein [Dactylosporangium sp. NPDC005572]|uniref:DUF5988 family protein n=1 Tax=Dactylosporangium sp. NPDC005572 TaxID=3156889 RepID=UPI0033BB44EE
MDNELIADDGPFIDAVLDGGPADIPAVSRRQRATPEQLKIKLPRYNGYEHFERTADGAPDQPVVFRWAFRTRIAE